jgi:hypothetical protein
VQDLFGEMGQPDAPMSQIMSALQMMTANNLQGMDPARVEAQIRQLTNLSRSSGMSMGAVTQMLSAGGIRAQQIGVDPAFSPMATASAMAYGQVYGQTMGGVRAYGLFNKDQATMLEQQMRLNAVGSQTAMNMAAAVRAAELGPGAAPGSELEAISAAIRAGSSQYQFGNARRSVDQGNRIIDIIEEGTGRTGLGYRLMSQRDALQRTIFENPEIADLARQQFGQRNARVALYGAGSYLLGTPGRENFGLGQADLQQILGESVQSTLSMDPKMAGKAYRGGVDDPFVEMMAGGIEKKLGRSLSTVERQRLRSLSGEMGMSVDQQMAGTGYKNLTNLLVASNERLLGQAAEASAEQTAIGRFQSEYSKLGRSDVVRRISDAIQNARPGEDWKTLLPKVFGWQDVGAVKQADRDALEKVFSDATQIKQDFDSANVPGIRTLLDEAARTGDPSKLGSLAGYAGKKAMTTPQGTMVSPETQLLNEYRSGKLDVKTLSKLALVDVFRRQEENRAAMQTAIAQTGIMTDIRVTGADVERTQAGLRSGRGSGIDQAALLTDLVLADDAAVAALGPGAVDRLANTRGSIQRIRSLAEKHTQGNLTKLLSTPPDALRGEIDELMSGIRGTVDYIGSGLKEGKDKLKGQPQDVIDRERARLESLRSDSNLDPKSVSGQLLQILGVQEDDFGTFAGRKKLRQVLEEGGGARLADVLPQIRRAADIGLESRAMKNLKAAGNVNPNRTEIEAEISRLRSSGAGGDAVRSLLSDTQATGEARQVREALIRSGGASLVETLDKAKAGEADNLTEILKGLKSVLADVAEKKDKDKGPTEVTLAADTRLHATVDLVGMEMLLTPQGAG